MTDTVPRTRADRCPGVLRPWPAEDGALVRLRLVGGRLGPASLAALAGVAASYGDGRVHLTARANLQLRGLPLVEGRLPEEVVTAIEATGLLPSRSHELVRNLMLSPQSGLAGGRADLRPVAAELDRLVRTAPALSRLPGRFLVVLDDGRGDLVDRPTDLGAAAVDGSQAQLRVGSTGWGPVVALSDVPRALVELAHAFLAARGAGSTAPWHVDELAEPLGHLERPHPGVPRPSAPLPHGRVPGGDHVAAPDGVLDQGLVARLVAAAGDPDLVVTPWHGVLVPEVGR